MVSFSLHHISYRLVDPRPRDAELHLVVGDQHIMYDSVHPRLGDTVAMDYHLLVETPYHKHNRVYDLRDRG